jgi:hypothetical protein
VDLDIRYARSGGVSIAYQVVGEGEVDLAYVPDYVSNVEYARSGDVAVAYQVVGDKGVHELKGIPGEWRFYAVAAA